MGCTTQSYSDQAILPVHPIPFVPYGTVGSHGTYHTVLQWPGNPTCPSHPICTIWHCGILWDVHTTQSYSDQVILPVCTCHGTHEPQICIYMFTYVINPRRACARVTVLVLSVCLCVCVCVCVCVCFPYSGTSRNQAYKQQYQRLQRDTGMKYKKGFFFKTLRSEVMASFTHFE